jgi:osmotically-inducible protein OsmY
MKTDGDLQRDVMAELARDPAVRSPAVGVAVKDGVVTLNGHLDTFAEKYAVEKALGRLHGIEAIAVELDVQLSPGHKRSDADIATAAEQVLKWNTLVPRGAIRVTVERGWVTLEGEVEWDYQRRSIQRTISPVTGVRGISHRIALRVKAQVTELSHRIEDALANYTLAQLAERRERTGRVRSGSTTGERLDINQGHAG